MTNPRLAPAPPRATRPSERRLTESEWLAEAGKSVVYLEEEKAPFAALVGLLVAPDVSGHGKHARFASGFIRSLASQLHVLHAACEAAGVNGDIQSTVLTMAERCRAAAEISERLESALRPSEAASKESDTP